MPSAVLFVATGLLVLAQGGFFPLATCLIGTVVCVAAAIAWLRKPRRGEGAPIVPLLLVGMALAYGLSALLNGVSLTTLAETGSWAACAGVAFLAAAQDVDKRTTWMKVLTWFGVATAAAGIFVCSGLLPLDGGMVGERLQFTFQYANATAAWYGICSFLCLLSPDNRQRSCAALPIAALLLTESGGGLLTFFLAIAVLCFRWVRTNSWELLFRALVQGTIAVVLFAAVRITMSPVSLIALAAAMAVCCLLMFKGERFMARVNVRLGSIALMAVVVACAVVAFVLLPERVADAVSSMGERAYHVKDGLMLWAVHPVFGIGPDNWQYLYPYIQTAPYYTTVVHSSFVQIMLDAGIAGIAFFVAACAVGMFGLVRDWKDRVARKGWESAELMAAAFLLVHSFLDFDLQFGSLAFMLMFFLSAPSSPRLKARATKSLLAGLVCLIVCVPACITGLLCASTSSALELAESTGDYAMCEQLFERNPLAQVDVKAQSHYLASLYGKGRYDAVAETYPRMTAPTERDGFTAALACYAMQNREQATSIMIKFLQEHPYSTAFLDGALQLAEAYGVDPLQESAFYGAVENARLSCGIDA